MLDILFVMDYVCPYCLAAKAAIDQALEELKAEAKIVIQPLELTQEPKPRVNTCGDEKRKAGYQVLVKPCRDMGLDVKLPPEVCPRPYTRLAFEGFLYAREQGKGEEYTDRIFRAYFIDEKDIGDMEVLCEAAADTGLEREDFRQALVDGLYGREEKEMVRHSREELKVTSVPAIYVNGERIVPKTYTKEEMEGLLRKYVI